MHVVVIVLMIMIVVVVVLMLMALFTPIVVPSFRVGSPEQAGHRQVEDGDGRNEKQMGSFHGEPHRERGTERAIESIAWEGRK